MPDYEAEKIVKKTQAVRKKIREFYQEFPQYCPYAHIRTDNQTKAKTNKTITKKVMAKHVEPDVVELVDDIKSKLKVGMK